MSTIDPREARVERESRAQDSPVTLILAIVSSLAALAVGAGLTYGILGTYDTHRLMSLNDVFDTWESQIPIEGPMTALMVCAFASFLVLPLQSRFAARLSGFFGRMLQIIPFGSVGALLMSLSATSFLTAPTVVGMRVAPDGSRREPWGFWEWLLYWAPSALPLVLLVVVAVMTYVRIRGVGKRQRIVKLATSGTRTIGRVIEVSGGNLEINGAPLITLSVQFTDTNGVVRYVTKRRAINRVNVPVVGQELLVMYDAAHPSDEKNIAFGMGDPGAVADAAKHR